MDTISVVVPCYNEQESLPLFYEAISRVRAQLVAAHPSTLLELVLVDDGSADSTLAAMRDLAARAQADEGIQVRYYSFSRNFGKESALLCGLRNARGDYVAVMDADLQDPPELLCEMYDRLLAGEADCVAARRQSREGEPWLRSVCSRAFYRFMARISETEVVDGARDFRLMTRQMTDAVLSLTEYNRFSKGLFSWVGFKTEWLSYDNVERVAGTTSWSFWGLVRYAIEGVVDFSAAPLTAASRAGLALCVIAVIATIVIFVRALAFGDPVPGWPSLACIITFIGGLELFFLGVIGKYLANTYLETKHRPAYIVRESNEAEAEGVRRAETAYGDDGDGDADPAGTEGGR
ncbi:MAG: glycosyltransferase family 2 protein [Atopobiaceae bacterium]|jgi:glycosyltransferase involved in cell wall biosynthesis|nr:glycosyltransferase family 2 protein [Atopobiaceae bacterium]MCH4120488.1 glycosyltransferase family 2 protein [Atopobiaceae bacterium]MCI1318154.1 glycosyltransferase family 2 protein [Atopobiaceae bacterium]MCI1388326.1 glycosyltransferase family 2 protein [Atopobiaceae bacterium]MCI1431424.1 glycosyltransferase family 2 protein [Atopobiaceae bacterium]